MTLEEVLAIFNPFDPGVYIEVAMEDIATMDALRAENEQLKAVLASHERFAAVAEEETVRADAKMEELGAELKALRTENERLMQLNATLAQGSLNPA